MDALTWSRIKDVYAEAVERPAEQRGAFLDSACGHDAALRAEVDSLLAADADAGEFLRGSASAFTPDDSGAARWSGSAERRSGAAVAPEERPGAVIDRYTLIEPLGEGGFGSVHVAEQREPVRRRVALKIIKLGMDTRNVVRRFEAERQALALMDHPHIAKVFDGGVTESGRPYFVMELVDGEPITDYCRAHELGRRERLALFGRVCQAVQHAHQKGVIHRDLKPSNILVSAPRTAVDEPAAKVIDFGVAKATAARLTDATLITERRQLVGTPAYMSPEQIGVGEDIDTRSDVYALGVLLYELLTNRLPFDPETLSRASLAEIQRIIGAQEPVRPSSLDPALRGDLEWIVMKALEKDRTRRYDTAAALAQDVARHLAHEPVLAGPPGAGYRFRKFARRHRGALTAAAIASAGLLIGVVMLAAGLVQTSRALRRAELAEKDALEQKDAADTARAGAIVSRDQAEAMVAFLQRMLISVEPERSLGRVVTVQELLQQAAERIGTEFPDNPVVEARLRHAIGVAYWSLARYPEAEQQLGRALELLEQTSPVDERLLALNLNSLGNLLQSVDRLAEAEAQFRRALALAGRAFDESSDIPIMILGNLGHLLVEQSRFADAEPLLREALDRAERVSGTESLRTSDALANLAQLYERSDRTQEAEVVYERTLALRRRLLPARHPDIAQALRGLGQVRVERGDYAGAATLFEEMIEIDRAVLGRHPRLARSLTNLADLEGRLGNNERAEQLLREAEGIQREAFGDVHTDVAFTLNNLAGVLHQLGRPADAMDALRESISIHRAVSGGESPDVASGTGNLAILLLARKEYDEAERVALEALELQRKLQGDDSAAVRSTLLTLANIQQAAGKLSEAEATYREVVQRADALPENHTGRWTARTALGDFLSSTGKLDEAERLLLAAHAELESRAGAEHPATRQAARFLANLYERLDDPDQAARWRERGRDARP